VSEVRYRGICIRAAEDGALPTEFELFPAGVSPSTNDTILVDERSAELVMSRAARHGVDHMIDLNHYSLRAGPDSDPTAADARGWFNLEIRSGAVWAVNVTWTEDGAARIRDRRQRYISPAYLCEEWDAEKEMPRLTEVLNCALVAMPATYGAQPLIGRLDGRGASGYAPRRMSLDKLKAALEAGDVEAAKAALASVEAAPSEPAPDAPASEPESAPADAPSEEPAPEVVAEAPAAEEPAPAPAPEAQPSALESELRSITGASDNAGALAVVRSLLTARDNAVAAERRSLIASLVELGAETPATAWRSNAPVERLASEPLESLRSRVASLRGARPTAPAVNPPATGEGAYSDLTDLERAEAEKIKDPEARSRFVAIRRERHNRASR
jgi:hypothetical protein